MAPTGDQIAMGGEDGQIYLLAVDEIENLPLTVTATHVSRRTSTRIQRFFGRSQLTHAYTCTCPACRQSFELPKAAPGLSAPCPYCTRTLRLSTITPGGF